MAHVVLGALGATETTARSTLDRIRAAWLPARVTPAWLEATYALRRSIYGAGSLQGHQISSDAALALRDEGGNRAWPERRSRPTGPFDSFRGLRGRRHGRRRGESEDSYVDLYTPRDVALLVSILVLNVLDAFFTLRWLQMGGREANPIMDWVLGFGDTAFLVQKCIVVGIWLLVLTVHKNFRIARMGLWSLLVLYSLVLVYHCILQAGFGPAPQLPGAG